MHVKPQAVWYKAVGRMNKKINATTVVVELDITNISTERHPIRYDDIWCVLKVIPRTSSGGLNFNSNVKEYTYRFPYTGIFEHPAGYTRYGAVGINIDYTEYSRTYGDQFELTLYSDNGNIEVFSPSPLIFDPTQAAPTL